MKIGFIGTGNMAEALIKGLLSKKVFHKKNIIGFDINKKRLTSLKRKYGIQVTTELNQIVSDAHIILLAVKPQQMADALNTLCTQLKTNQLVISIAAGLPLSFYTQRLGKKIKIVRVMPNTPAMVNLGVAAFLATKNCSLTDKKQVTQIFNAVGLCFEVKKESLLDSVTAISGSGPAYVYLFAQAMIQSAIKLKLNPTQSKLMVIQTLLGATSLLQQSNESPQELIKKVASKGGTTEAALLSFSSSHFEAIIDKAIQQA